MDFTLGAGVTERRRVPWMVRVLGDSTAGNDGSVSEEPLLADIEGKPDPTSIPSLRHAGATSNAFSDDHTIQRLLFVLVPGQLSTHAIRRD